jgi:hypothetical protein
MEELMKARILVACLSLLAVVSAASAIPAPTIVVGTHIIDPANSATWQIPIYVTGGNAIGGCNFNAQIGDGGPAAGAGGTLGPVITSVDLEHGIFLDRNDGQTDLGSIPQVGMYSITTSSGTVGADGLLATLTIDPTGFTSGTWDLKLRDTFNGDTDFAPMPASITNGTITVTPEPATVTLLGLGALALIRRVRRS